MSLADLYPSIIIHNSLDLKATVPPPDITMLNGDADFDGDMTKSNVHNNVELKTTVPPSDIPMINCDPYAIQTKLAQKLAMTPAQEKQEYKIKQKEQVKQQFQQLKAYLASKNGRTQSGPPQYVRSKADIEPKKPQKGQEEQSKETEEELEARTIKEHDVTLAKINGDDKTFDRMDLTNLSRIIVGMVRVFANNFWKGTMPKGEQVLAQLQNEFSDEEQSEMFEFMTEAGWLMVAHAHFWQVFDELGGETAWFVGTCNATGMDGKLLKAFLRMGVMRPLFDPQHTNHKYLEAVKLFVPLPHEKPAILPAVPPAVPSSRQQKKKKRAAKNKKKRKQQKQQQETKAQEMKEAIVQV